MVTPIEIKIENFMSYEDSTFSLNSPVIVLSGKNWDADNGPRSNGSGKSGIIDAIYFAITGESLRGLSNSEMIRRGELSAKVSLKLRDNKTDQVIDIQRTIRKKSSSKVIISTHKDAIGVSDAKKIIIEDIIGVSSKDDIKNYAIISKGNYTPFFTMTDSKIKNIINKMVKIDMVDSVFIKIKNKGAKISDAIDDLTTQKYKYIGAVDALEDQLMKIDADGDPKKGLIGDSEAKIKEIEIEIKRSQVNMDKLKSISTSKRDKFTDLINKINLAVDKIDDKSASMLASIHKLQSSIHGNQSLVSKYSAQLEGAISCPKCQHKFSLEGDLDEIRNSLESVRSVIKKDTNSVGDIRIMREEMDKKRESVMKKGDEVRKSIDAIDHKITIVKNKIRDKRIELSGLKKNLEVAMKSQDVGDRKKNIKRDIKAIKMQLNKISKEIQLHNDKLVANNSWGPIFKKFKHFLLVKALDAINSKINYELNQINPALKIEIEGFKINKNGDVSDKITTRVYQNEAYIGEYRTFSGGEKTEINLASIFALNKINTEMSDGGIDLVCLDEIIESVDPVGSYAIFKYLESQDKQVIAVTHSPPNSNELPNTKNVIVEKKNGVSRIVTD